MSSKFQPNYIIEYVAFLSRLNDEQNIRSLFERALSTLPPEKSINIGKATLNLKHLGILPVC